MGLHAVAKAATGAELSGLERRAAHVLQQVVPADELSTAGQMFTEAQSRAGGPVSFPASVAGLPATGTYAMTDFEADLQILGEQVLAQPNCRVVHVEDLQAGEPFDSAEFLAAMGEHRSALTIFTGASQPGATATPMKVAIRPTRFICHAETGDGAFTNSDEIYWMSGGSCDGGFDTVYASGEFGDLDKGETRNFPAISYAQLGDGSGGLPAVASIGAGTRNITSAYKRQTEIQGPATQPQCTKLWMFSVVRGRLRSLAACRRLPTAGTRRRQWVQIRSSEKGLRNETRRPEGYRLCR